MRTWRDEARDHARVILQRMLLAVNPQHVIRTRLRHEDGALVLPDGTRVPLEGRVRVAAIGKAAGGMAAHAQPWGPFEEAVLVAHTRIEVPGFETFVGGHPEPSEDSVAAGERVLRMAHATREGDTLLVLLSGGASALCEAPAVPLVDLQQTTRLLLGSGADIAAVNTVRRHLSRLKGGRLLQAAKGRIVVLAISDVAHDDLRAIGSGPAAPDASTFADAVAVLGKHGILEAVPASVRAHLEAGRLGEVAETLKPGDTACLRLTSAVLAGNEDALHAGAQAAQGLGYEVHVVPEALVGEARHCGRRLAEEARRIAARPGPPVALVWGGETVVRLMGAGKGGRSQETALAAVDALSALGAVLVCMGTDGRDGPTDAAGALVDGMTRARAESLGFDASSHLAENDAYPYFDALDDLIRTGPTGTNVRDVAVLLVGARGKESSAG